MLRIAQISVVTITCLMSHIAVQAQVIRASQRYQLVVPEQLRVSVEQPTIIRNELGLEVRQAVEIQAQPSEGLVLQISIGNDTPEQIRRVSATDSLNQRHLSLEPGVVHWFQFPELRQSAAMAAPSEVICPELMPKSQTSRSKLSLELHFFLQQQPGRGAQTVIATITGSP